MTSPVNAVVIGRDEFVNLRYDFNAADKINVVVDSLSVFSVGKMIVEPFGGDRGHTLPHQDLAYGLV